MKRGKARSLALAALAAALLFPGCSADDQIPLGTLLVSTTTAGDNPDANGYLVRVTGPGIDATRLLSQTGRAVFTVESQRDYTATMTGVADNCAVDLNPQTAASVQNRVVTIRFNILCS